MKPEATTVTVHLTGGKEISFETGSFSCSGHAGSGSVDPAAGRNRCPRHAAPPTPIPHRGRRLLPLFVGYRRNTYAGGRFPGGFIKRAGQRTEREVLTSRQIDHGPSIRLRRGVQVQTQVIALFSLPTAKTILMFAASTRLRLHCTFPIFPSSAPSAQCAWAW